MGIDGIAVIAVNWAYCGETAPSVLGWRVIDLE
jgi:hypothetical protein